MAEQIYGLIAQAMKKIGAIGKDSAATMARPGSPENQLGACWLGLGDSRLRSTGYGIHGTPDESSVTRNLSAGCIRMRNKEVLELRSRVPVGTPVMIEN